MQLKLYEYNRKKSAKVEHMSPDILKYEANKPAYKDSIVPLVSTDYEVGIEIEVERVTAHHNPIYYPVWVTKADNSLRDGGVEYVSVPIKGNRIHYALNQWYGEVDSARHFSPRTSIHIHLNVLDMTPKQIAAFIITYLPFERMLFRFVGGDRDRNNFCVPLLDAIQLNQYLSILRSDSFAPFSMEQHRYLALNLDSIRKFGTLEFRHLGGTDDKRKVAKWINLIFCFKKYAVENTWEDIKERIGRLNSNSMYTAFFNDVLGPCSYYLDSPDLKREMESAVTRIKRLSMDVNQFHYDATTHFSKADSWYKKLREPEKKVDRLMFNTGPAPRQARPARPAGMDDGLEARIEGVRQRIRERERINIAEPLNVGGAFLYGANPPPPMPVEADDDIIPDIDGDPFAEEDN